MVDKYTVKRAERTWTSKKGYVICSGKKELFTISDRDEAIVVCDYLNNLDKKTAKKSTRKPRTKKEDK